MIYIYDKNLEYIPDVLPYTFQELESLGLSLADVYSKWKPEFWAVGKFYAYPKLEDGALKEKTPEELKLEKILPPEAGEYISDAGELIKVERPAGLKIVWDFEKNQWVETATSEELYAAYVAEQQTFLTSELEATNKFDLVNYRVFVTNQGDNIEEMDAYRLALLDMQQSLNAPVRTRAKRSASFAVLEKPAWAAKY